MPPQPRHSLARSTSCYINQSLSTRGRQCDHRPFAADAAAGAASSTTSPPRWPYSPRAFPRLAAHDAAARRARRRLEDDARRQRVRLRRRARRIGLDAQFARRAKRVRTHATLQRAELADSPSSASAAATAAEPDPRWAAARRLQHAFRHWTRTRTAAPPPSLGSAYEVTYRAPRLRGRHRRGRRRGSARARSPTAAAPPLRPLRRPRDSRPARKRGLRATDRRCRRRGGRSSAARAGANRRRSDAAAAAVASPATDPRRN